MAAAPPKGFTIIPFEGKDVYVTTLPKGTLLYRGVKTLDKIKQDLFGTPDATQYCLSPNYNVFFYPFPFADSIVGTYSHLLVYVVMNDINLATLISPSKMTRGDRHSGVGAIVSCSTIPTDQHGCKLEGRDYDPCFKPAFRTAHPDVSGMIGFAGIDQSAFLQVVQNYREDTPVRHHLNKYLTTYVDATGKPGIPELVLYPFTHRQVADILTPTETKIVDWYTDHAATASYRVWHVMKRDDDSILEFLETSTTTGFNGSVVKLDKRTGFYVCEADADSETKKHLVDIRVGKEWAMTKDVPEFRFKKGVVPVLDFSDETYEKTLSSIEAKITNQIRKQSPGRTKYADRLAHVLAEVVLIVMATAAGLYYYEGLEEEGTHEDFCPTNRSYDDCANLITEAIQDIPTDDAESPVNEETEYGGKLDGALEVGYTKNKQTEAMFKSWHPSLVDALLNASYVKESQTYDRAKMIDVAATLAMYLLRSTMDLGYGQMVKTHGSKTYATKIAMDHLKEVADLLTYQSDYGEEQGWVNDAFYRRFGAPDGYWHNTPTNYWGDWRDELDEEKDEEEEKPEEKPEEKSEEKPEEKPEGGYRRRTYRVRRTSLRRRR